MPLSIVVGGLPVMLSSSELPLIAALERRYHLFVADGTLSPSLHVAIELAPPQPEAARVTLSGPMAQIAGPDRRAQIDLTKGAASLRVSPASAGPAVEELLRVAYAMLAFAAGGLLVHAAAIVGTPGAHLFLGPSGAGKTTVARNANGRTVLNDDLVLLLPAGDIWVAHATPFANPTQVQPSGPAHAPLASLHYLVQDIAVYAAPLSTATATALLVAHVPMISSDPRCGAQLLQRARTLTARYPAAQLHLRPDTAFWAVVEPAN